MSESDHKELPDHEWFDSKSELPEILSVDSTLAIGVNVSFPSADHTQGVRALDFGNSNTMGPAPNTGILVGHVPQEETESSKGENFLDPTPPQIKSLSPIPFHRGWAMGRGRKMKREGGKVLQKYEAVGGKSLEDFEKISKIFVHVISLIVFVWFVCV